MLYDVNISRIIDTGEEKNIKFTSALIRAAHHIRTPEDDDLIMKEVLKRNIAVVVKELF